MSKAERPPNIAVHGAKSEEDAAMGDRQTSLLPGQVRTPSYIVTMADWAAPGSTVWDEDEVPPAATAAEPLRTPLAGYVNEGEVWVAEDEGVAHADGAEGDDMVDTAHVAHAALSELRARLDKSPVTAQPPSSQLPVKSMPPRTESEYWGFSTNPNQQRSSPNGSAPPDPSVPASSTGAAATATGGFTFRVSDGSDVPSQPSQPALGPYTASSSRPAARPPTLEDERVAHSIIASAGLPLSVTSLLSYIKDGQPHLEQSQATTSGHRNFPNLSEPAPEEMGPMPGTGYNNNNRGGAGGGWTVEVDPSAGAGPYRGGYQPNMNMGYGRGGGGGGMMMMGGGNQGPYRSAPNAAYMSGPNNNNNVGNNMGVMGGGAGVGAGGRRFQQPTYANVVAGNVALNNNSNGSQHTFGGPNPMGAGARAGGGAGVSGGSRPKSESEILSDLLHFHANFFPPPPPPHVPVEERRRRAELWYHYASKWDITHRLPPPPRSPLSEMEMEYRMKLPEKTRVPYHGDDWLRQCDLWFRVVQSLFDYPEENITVEVDLNVILEHAVLS